MSSNSGQYLGYLHSFRGFAILNIVLIHAVVAALVAIDQMNMSNPIALVNEVLFHDSTIYFAIISGLLFSAILQNKGWKRFFVNKVKYVVLPYLFITTIVSILKVSFPQEELTNTWIVSFFSTLGRDFLYGKAIGLYWYIPVLFFLYAVTPLLDYIMKLKKVGLILSIIIMLLPLVFTRVQMAFEYILSIQTMIYFTGAYMVGMFIGSDLENRLNWINKNLVILIIISVLSTAALFVFFIQDINMVGFISLQETLFYIQKICLSGVFIVMFKKIGENQPKWLGRVAKDSFAIYFIHGFLVFGGIPLFMFILGLESISPLNTLLGTVILALFGISVSMLLTLGFRKMLGNRSRMFVGS